MQQRGIDGGSFCSFLLLMFISIPILFSSGAILAADRVVLGELFNRDG